MSTYRSNRYGDSEVVIDSAEAARAELMRQHAEKNPSDQAKLMHVSSVEWGCFDVLTFSTEYGYDQRMGTVVRQTLVSA